MTLTTASTRSRSLIALALLVPAPTLGVLMAMHFMPGPAGQAIYFNSKAWILILPLAWLMLVDRGRPAVSPPWRAKGLAVGLASGLLISGIIVGAYLTLGEAWIDPDALRAVAERNGLTVAWKYLGLAAYLCFINSLLEEYVWRWFVFHHCAALLPRWPAVILSGLFFTVHHIFALGLQFDWRLTLLGSIGVCVGGIVWSWLYLKYDSVWPGWLSHLLVDVAIFAVGWHMLFAAA